MEIATFEREKELAAAGWQQIIGIDEVGRGPLAGPTVAAACLAKDPALYAQDPEENLWRFVRDSKSVSEKKREEVDALIREYFYVGIGVASPATIDRVNILQATFLAMKEALSRLAEDVRSAGAELDETQSIILLDGNQYIPNTTRAQKTVAQGDRHVKSIAAASIAAKVVRDHMMIALDAIYPVYGFAGHKGYGTKAHMEALAEHGPCKEHRLSFAPVKKAAG